MEQTPIQTDEQAYQEGFNDAAILASHNPEAFSIFTPEQFTQSDYASGFFDGKDYYEHEKKVEQEFENLQALRENSREYDREDYEL